MKLSEYTNMLRRFGLIYTLKEIYYRFYSNILEKRICLKRDRDMFHYLKRYNNAHFDISSPHNEYINCIWTCWFQGYDKAPPIIKACINSMHKYSNGYKVIVLTEETIPDYVSMPDYIIKKYKAGIISPAHFSDLLRTLLLITYGGIWLDATVFLTGNIPQYLLSAELFMFQSSILNNEYRPCSNWFIIAKKNNFILIKVFEILINYWKNNNQLLHYFIFHITVKFIITYIPEAKNLWNEMFYKNNSDPHLLQKKLFDKLEPNMKDHIWNLSFAHKLTYKFDDKSLMERDETYFQYILNTAKQ
jgi:mannosyltransferase OCH1-like enzyme